MKTFAKRSAALLIAFLMILSLVPASVLPVSAASYIYNWGSRGTVATELSDAAMDFYEKYNVEYEDLAALSGSSTVSSVPSSALYQELQSLMTKAHTTKTSYDGTKSMYQYTDCQNGGGKISSFYSGTSIGPGWGEGGSWNREHTWPKSKSLNGSGNGGQDETDIIMLRPTSEAENSSRGNTAYGESGSYYDPNDESNGKYNLHGDVARIVLYVYVRWGNSQYMWGTSGVMESKEVLLKWMEEDPVDTWELGRNDVVEDITGTRNVFVDYPELAFELFNEPVPADMDTPSGGAVSYNISAQSNNTSYGTVSVSGNKITAYPYDGYVVSGYQVVSGTANVTQDGNVFRVDAQSDCVVRINFVPRTKVTVSFSGASVAAQTGYAGDSMKLPTATAPEGFAFLGWTAAPLGGDVTEKPDFYTDSFVPTVNTTLYALYSYVDGEGTTGSGDYVKVTSAPADWSGEYLIVYEADGYIFDGSLKSFDAVSNYKAVTISNGTIAAEQADPYKFIITAVNGGYSIQGTSGGYIGHGSNANGLTTGSSALVNKISLDSSGNANIIGSGGAYLRYNASSGQYRFRYYKTGSYASQKPIALYVKDGSSGVTYYTSTPVICGHNNTSVIAAVAPTCTEQGYTAGVQCTDCGNIISGVEVVDALGHNWGLWIVIHAPTCTEQGQEQRECSACSAKETQPVAATGHNYNSVVTPPTAAEQGYTTYTCSSCGNSHVSDYTEALGYTYTVRFVVPKGVDAVGAMTCGKNGITLPEAGVPTGDYDYTFAGWVSTPVDNNTVEPEILTGSYTATADTTLYALYTYNVGGSGDTEYVLKEIADITPTDTVVITVTKGSTSYALPNTVNSEGPDAANVTVKDGKLTAEPADNLKWNIGGSEGSYIFYVNGRTDQWLYCTNNNDGVRIGNNSSNTFKINSGYIQHNGTSRYVGVYTGKPDWRCYTSTSTNIGGQTLGFYVKGESGIAYYTTVIGDACSHENTTTETVPATCTGEGYTSVTCDDCGEELIYEVILTIDHNYVDGVCSCGAKDPNAPLVYGMDMVLSDDLKVNFYLNDRVNVVVFVGDDPVEIVAEDLTVADNGKFVATVSVAAAQMTEEITVSGGGKDSAVYTIRQYADKILADDAHATWHNLVKEMLNYGAYAQSYFTYNTDNLANKGITGVGETDVPAAAAKDVSVTGSAEGISFYAASLVYKDKVAVRFYFEAESIDGLTFTANGNEYEATAKGGFYVVEIPNVDPGELDQQITVVATDAEGGSLTVNYGPMNYIVRMYAKGDENLKALLKALYNYHLAAKVI